VLRARLQEVQQGVALAVAKIQAEQDHKIHGAMLDPEQADDEIDASTVVGLMERRRLNSLHVKALVSEAGLKGVQLMKDILQDHDFKNDTSFCFQCKDVCSIGDGLPEDLPAEVKEKMVTCAVAGISCQRLCACSPQYYLTLFISLL
jgi:hypothetical protein